MKINIKNNKLSLSNTNDYKVDIEFGVKEAIYIYIELVIEYCHFIKDNIKDKKCDMFIINRGLDTLTHVFKFVLFYTKNLEYVSFYTQKAFYYYVEFICQTSEMEKLFLQMTSRDAVTYVYKKTIYEINKTFVNSNIINSVSTLEKINIIDEHINLYKTIIIKILNGGSPISVFETFFEHIKNSIIVNDIKTFNIEIENLFYTIEDIPTFIDLLNVHYNNNKS
uniref:Uncharacterized protein n=1 Tax=viral metagenome TaxID=1070528 RepID=A0A6C0E4F2_9ZZZZ